MQTLLEIVRGTEQFRTAEASGKLLRFPTGDGGALVFRTSVSSPGQHDKRKKSPLWKEV